MDTNRQQLLDWCLKNNKDPDDPEVQVEFIRSITDQLVKDGTLYRDAEGGLHKKSS